ncbi:transposase, partial [Massilia genomosp. 1]|uniref:transposase n=1 Tax=Massilia genomosp. 1 TaxID=2609280 RepID=UPI001E398EA3
DGTPQSRKKCHGSRHQKGEKSSTQKSSVKIVFRRQLACKFPPLAFYNHHYRSTCYLPLMIFDGASGGLIAAVLRPGKRPFGDE